MPKNTIREKFAKEFGMPEFKGETFVKHGTYIKEVADFFLAEFDSLLAEKVKKIRQLFREFEKDDLVMVADDIIQILKQDI